MSVADPEKPTAAVTFGMEKRVPLLVKRHVNPERFCNVTSTKEPSSGAISSGVGFIYLYRRGFRSFVTGDCAVVSCASAM
jgi:hypothetical protein